MELRDVTDKPEIMAQDAIDGPLDRRIDKAEDYRPGTFRYSDAGLGGEVRTSVAQEGGLYNVAKAEVFRPDGTSEIVGTGQYTVAGGEATLDGTHFTARNHGTEWALLKEASEQARAQGADRMRVWMPDDDPDPARWLRHGFQPAERDPGAKGAHWERKV